MGNKIVTNKLIQAITPQGKRDDTLKLIGMASMLVDHIGLIFFPQVAFLRIIGRLALPIFAFSLSQGFYYTSNLRKYVQRLLVFALVAQIPFIFLINFYTLNIIFTLLVALLLLFSLQKKNILAILLVVLLVFLSPIEYSWYGVALCLIFYYSRKDKLIGFVLASGLTIFYSYWIGVILQSFAILGIVLIYWRPKEMPAIQLPRLFFYWFYPVHLALFIFIIYTTRFIRFIF